MELVLIAFVQFIVVIVSVFLGYKMGKGEDIKLNMRPMKRAVRTEAREAEIEAEVEEKAKLRRAING